MGEFTSFKMLPLVLMKDEDINVVCLYPELIYLHVTYHIMHTADLKYKVLQISLKRIILFSKLLLALRFHPCKKKIFSTIIIRTVWYCRSGDGAVAQGSGGRTGPSQERADVLQDATAPSAVEPGWSWPARGRGGGWRVLGPVSRAQRLLPRRRAMRQVLRLPGRQAHGEALPGRPGLQWLQPDAREVRPTLWHRLLQATQATWVFCYFRRETMTCHERGIGRLVIFHPTIPWFIPLRIG